MTTQIVTAVIVVMLLVAVAFLAGRRTRPPTLVIHPPPPAAVEVLPPPVQVVSPERQMFQNAIELAEVDVSAVMVHRRNMLAIDARQPSAAIAEQILESPHTRIPMWTDDPDNVIGVLNVKAALRALGAAGGQAGAIDFSELTDEPWFVPETTTLARQLAAFRRRRTSFALVVDEYGTLRGLVTMADIVERVVGGFPGDGEESVPEFRALPDGRYLISGTAMVHDLNRELGWHLPEDEATTIAGLLINEAQVIPEPGQSFEYFGFRFEVLRRHRNQITTLRLTPAAPPPEAVPA